MQDMLMAREGSRLSLLIAIRSACDLVRLTSVTHDVIFISGVCLRPRSFYFRCMSWKRMVGSTAIIETRVTWNLHNMS